MNRVCIQEQAEPSKLNSPLKIYDFQKEDLEQVLQLEEKCFPPHEREIIGLDATRFGKVIDRMFGVSGRFFLWWLSSFFGREPLKILTAKVNENIVGAVIFSIYRRTCYVSRIMVDPNFQRRKIATQLMKKIFDYAQGRASKVVLHVNSSNIVAKKFYNKLGFKIFEQIIYSIASISSLNLEANENGIIVRAFNNSDAQAVFELIEESLEKSKHFDANITGSRELEISLPERLFGSFSPIPASKRLVALKDKELIGYALVRHSTTKAGRIENLIVADAWGSTRVERILIKAAANLIKDTASRSILVILPSSKTRLIDAIEKLGFETCLAMDGYIKELVCQGN